MVPPSMSLTRTPRPATPTIAPPRGAAGSAREWLASRARSVPADGSILMHAPSSAFQAPGGGENQLVQTARHLEASGDAVRLFSPWCDRLEDFAILHLFGMSREGLELARIARKRGVPVALSPICWLEPRALYALARSRAVGLWHLAKWSLKGRFPRVGGWRDELIRQADLILPNSVAEAGQLARLFGASAEKVVVVPNGVDARFEQADPGLFRSIHGGGDFILYAGRIEPRKNVLGLIRAARRVGRPMRVIGNAPPGHEGYLAECRAAGGSSTRWHGGVDHDDPLLASAYAAARVFALPSWFETPGLAALEAGLAGTAVVLTPNGCTREYFRDGVEYARPDRIGEIASALEAAWDDGPRPGLRETIRSQYLWTTVAQRTAEAYAHVMH